MAKYLQKSFPNQVKLDFTFSAKFDIRVTSGKKDQHPIYLLVVINRQVKRFNTQIRWYEHLFDGRKTEPLSPRSARDKECVENNLIVSEILTRAFELQRRYRIEGKLLTMDTFTKEFLNKIDRKDFLAFWERKLNELSARGVLAPNTVKSQKSSLKTLMEFRNPLYFFDISIELLRDYQVFLKKRNFKVTTIASRFKDFRTFLNHAIEEGIKTTYPFQEFSYSKGEGSRTALSQEEVKSLKTLHESNELPHLEKISLERFLFSCYTGLRISDIQLIRADDIVDGRLELIPHKTRSRGKRSIILLPKFAFELVKNRKGELFPSSDIVEQTINKNLKIIAAKAGIKKNITMHVGRNTYATLYLKLGGNIETLKDLMGHADLRTTAIYPKMIQSHADELMKNFNDI